MNPLAGGSLKYLQGDVRHAEQYENKAYQYQWAMHHPVVKEAITRALDNRFPRRS